MNSFDRLALTCLLALAAPCFSGGCASTRAPYDSHVQFLGVTSPFVEVRNARMSNETGTPIVAAEIVNTSTLGSQSFSWQIEFRNRNGLQIALADTRWSHITLQPRESRVIQLAASDPSAIDFIIKLQPQGNNK